MKVLSEHETKQLLRTYGIPTTDFQVVSAREELAHVTVRFPVALKVSSPDVLHKTDVGGLRLNLPDEPALDEAFCALRKNFPNEPFIVEEMAAAGIEVIAGIVTDPAFGRCIMAGMGGIFTEVYEDVAFRLAPVNAQDAERMLEDLTARKVFSGYRRPVDRPALVNILLALSRMAEAENVLQLDLNPIFLYENGAIVIDAKGVVGG